MEGTFAALVSSFSSESAELLKISAKENDANSVIRVRITTTTCARSSFRRNVVGSALRLVCQRFPRTLFSQ